MDIDLSRLTELELLDLNRRIIERIRFLRQGRCRASIAEFTVGDRVSFQPDCGHEVIGTIIRLNQKSVTVVSTEGPQWRVAPGLLKKVTGANKELDARPRASVDDLMALAERQRRDRGKA